MRCDGPADRPVEIRSDLVLSALVEGVAGEARLDRGLALGGVGAGEQGGDGLRRGGGLGLALGAALRLGDRHGVTRLLGRLVVEDLLGEDADAEGSEERAEHGTGDLVEFEAVHLRHLDWQRSVALGFGGGLLPRVPETSHSPKATQYPETPPVQFAAAAEWLRSGLVDTRGDGCQYSARFGAGTRDKG